MPRALAAILVIASIAGCKGRTPNYIRVDLPVAGKEYGPEKPTEKGGYAMAFSDTLLHIAEASKTRITLITYREDGREESSQVLVEPAEDLWDLDPGRISGALGEEALSWKEHAPIQECLEAGPKKLKTRIAILPRGLAPLEKERWALAFSAVSTLVCEGGKRHTAALDYLQLLDGEWNEDGEPLLLRYGPEPRVHHVLVHSSEPALGWATQESAGISTAEHDLPLETRKGALEYLPIFAQAGKLVALVTRPANTIRVRLIGEEDALVDATVDPGSRPLSVAAAWAGDRLGVFFGLDRAEGVSSLLQHVLVELFPDGTVSAPIKVYTQHSMAEDTAFTRHLCACFTGEHYALAWIADDGYSQDLLLQEVPLSGKVTSKKAWKRDFREGFRALKAVALFPTPPQYVLHYLTASAATTHTHNVFLTAMPTDRDPP